MLLRWGFNGLPCFRAMPLDLISLMTIILIGEAHCTIKILGNNLTITLWRKVLLLLTMIMLEILRTRQQPGIWCLIVRLSLCCNLLRHYWLLAWLLNLYMRRHLVILVPRFDMTLNVIWSTFITTCLNWTVCLQMATMTARWYDWCLWEIVLYHYVWVFVFVDEM